MTQVFDKMKTMSSSYEASKLETYRVKLAAFKENNEMQNAAQTQSAYRPSSRVAVPKNQSALTSSGRQVHVSPSPTQYAYEKAQALRKSGKDAEAVLEAATNARPQRVSEQEYYKHTPQYHAQFRPDPNYIYVPPKTVTRSLINMDKANIGQTTYVPSLDETNETLYRNNFLQTQEQNNQKGRKATDGLEPVQAVYVVQQDGLNFAQLQSGRLAEPEMATGLIIKNLKRVKDEVDPKDEYLETFKRCHPDTAPGVRPNIGGSVFTRKITEKEWKEIPEDVKILKLDTRTTNRQMFIPPSQAALELSKRDRMASRAAFIKDHNGDNPVAGGVYHKPETWLTVSQRPLIEAQEEQMK